jgi:hypothetical protein
MGVQFKGSAKFNLTESQDDVWAEADTMATRAQPLTMGGLIHEARLRGFDARLAQWPKLREKDAKKADAAQATGKNRGGRSSDPQGWAVHRGQGRASRPRQQRLTPPQPSGSC